MINYQFTCKNCHVTFSMSEKSIMQSSSLACPHCHLNLPAGEFKHIKNDLKYRKEHSSFYVSVFDSPDINIENLSSYALDRTVNGLNNLFKNDPSQNIDSFIEENKYLLTFCNLYSRNILIAYHHQIADILNSHNIPISDIVQDFPFSSDEESP